jgi:pyruvate dehydrogenase E1 component beta subunit
MGSRVITFAAATLEAMEEEMARDDRVFLMGEDIARQGGIFGQFQGLPAKFGYHRVLDTPISETAIVGFAVGAALVGLRPVVDIHFADFMAITGDEVINQMAKMRYLSGGQLKVPMVIRAPDGVINSAAAHHSQSIESWFLNVPGLKVVTASTPSDAKGLLKSAIRDDDPVIFLEHKALYRLKGEVPDGEHLVPLGKAEIRRTGADATVVTYSAMTHLALQVAEELQQDGISVEVVDLRSLYPVDWETVLASVRRTRRALVLHEAPRFAGFGAELAATIQEKLFGDLIGPVLRLGAKHAPIPFSPPLEKALLPSANDIKAALRRLVAYR